MSTNKKQSCLTGPALVKLRCFRVLAGFIAAVVVAGAPVGLGAGAMAQAAPPRLSDGDFWKLVTDFSEPDGTFRSDNLVSNEDTYPTVMPRLVELSKPGRAYVGVGPEQNFNYIAVLKPDIACIVDIRRGNLDLHLMYKAIFELSSNRVDFVSRLFSRPAPANLTTNSTVSEIFTGFSQTPPSQELYTHNLFAVEYQLAKVHHFDLSSNDYSGIEYVYEAMFTNGPDLRYSMAGGRPGRGNFPSYTTVMEASDMNGRAWSYLSAEDSFAFIKDFESRNLIMPVVGNFGGPKALRAVASYLKEQHKTVAAFYVSNVEQYLRQDNIETNFLDSAATMPVDESSVFIRAARASFGVRGGGLTGRGRGPGSGLIVELDPMATNTVGHVPTP